MKILHYSGVYAPAWKWGGPPRSTANLCEGLVAIGHSVTVLATDSGLEAEPDIPRDSPVWRNGVTVHYFRSKHRFSGIHSSALERAVTERVEEFDLLHVTGVWQPTSVTACRAAESSGIPYVVSPRGALGRYSFTQKPWKKWPYWWLHERRNCSRASAVHCTSTLEMEECARFRFPGRAFVVPNSIDLSDWWRDEEAGRQWRREIGAGDSTRVFLYAGRMHHKKGLDLLPEVAARLKDRNFQMVFIGRDEDGTGSDLDAAFKSAGVRDRIQFLRMTGTEGLRAAYSGSNRFLLPSRHENFANVAVEALACGCPVMLSDKVGVARDLASCASVEVLPRIAGNWAQALTRSVASAGAEFRSWVESQFSLKEVGMRMSAVYESILAERS